MRSVQSLIGLLLVTGASVAGYGVIGLAGQSVAGTAGRPAVDAEGPLPKDVNPESRNRLPPITREQVSERLKKDYDAAVAKAPNGRLDGVAAIRFHRSGVDVRWDSAVGRRLSELSIISTAREHDQPYEWSLHHMEALSVGLEPAIVDVVNNRKPLTGLGEKEATIIQLAREFGKHRVTPETYARGVKLFGKTDFVDLVDLMSGYGSTAVNLTAANQFMPPQMKQFLTLPFTPPNDILPDSRSRIPVVNPNAAPARGGGGGGQDAAGMYRRTLAPPPTGPGSMGRFAAGLASLEASVKRPLIDLAALVTAREYDQQYEWKGETCPAHRLPPRFREALLGVTFACSAGRSSGAGRNVDAIKLRPRSPPGLRDLKFEFLGIALKPFRFGTITPYTRARWRRSGLEVCRNAVKD